MIDVKVINHMFVVTLPKAILVLSKEEFVRALKKGRWWKRRQSWQARHPEEEACKTPSPGR